MLIYTGELDPKLDPTVTSQPAVLVIPTDISLGAPIVFYHESFSNTAVKELGFIDQVTTRTRGSPSFSFSSSWRFDGSDTVGAFAAKVVANPAGLQINLALGAGATQRMIPDVDTSAIQAVSPAITKIGPESATADGSDAASSGPPEIIMSISIGQQSPVTGMVFKCAFASHTSPFSPYPSIYVGMLPQTNSSPTTMIVVVIPSSLAVGKTVCAYWQGTSNNRSNRSTIFKGSFTSVSASETKFACNVTFSDNTSTFVFQGWINTTDNTMILTMFDASSGLLSMRFTLNRSSLIPNSAGSSFGSTPPRSRQKREGSLALATTWGVKNDYPQDIVFCIFSSSPVSLLGQIVGAIGLGLGAVGLLSAFAGAVAASGTALATLTGPVTAIPFAIASATLAIVSFVDVMIPPNAIRHVILFPKEGVVYTSSGGIISANNGIFLRFSLGDSSAFTATMVTRTFGPGIGTYPLSTLFSQSSVTTILSLPLLPPSSPSPITNRLKLQYFRLVEVRGLSAPAGLQDATGKISAGDLANGVFHANEFPVKKGVAGLTRYWAYPSLLKAGKNTYDTARMIFSYIPGTESSSSSSHRVVRSKLGIFFVCMRVRNLDSLVQYIPFEFPPNADILDFLDVLLTTRLDYNAYWAFARETGRIVALDLSATPNDLIVASLSEPGVNLYIRVDRNPQVLSQWVEVAA